MRKTAFALATLAAMGFATMAFTTTASAQERRVTGAAIGAGVGAVVLGPIGAIAGGAVGAAMGGPRVSRSARTCWRGRDGRRHCRWR